MAVSTIPDYCFITYVSAGIIVIYDQGLLLLLAIITYYYCLHLARFKQTSVNSQSARLQNDNYSRQILASTLYQAAIEVHLNKWNK